MSSPEFTSSEPGTKHRLNLRLLFFLLAPIYLFSVFQRVAPSILASELALDLGVDVTDLAVMSSATFVAYGLMQLPAGLLTDAMGGRKTIALITLVAGLGVLLFASSSTLAGATASRFLVGLGCAACVPCMSMLAQYFPAHLYSRVSGLLMGFGVLGTVLAGSPLAYGSTLFGWRMIMVVCSFVSIALAALVWVFARENRPVPVSGEAKSGPGLASRLKIVISTRSFWPLCLWFSLIAGLFFAFGGLWWGPFLMTGCGLSKTQAGVVISTAYLVTVPGQPLMALLSERLRSRKKIFLGCTFVALGSMTVLPFFGPSMSYSLLIVHGIVFAAGGCTFAAIAFSSTCEIFPLEMVGTAMGCLQTLPYLIMVPLIQKMFGIVLEWRLVAHGGDPVQAYAEAIFVNVGFLLLAAFAVLFIKETYRADSEEGH